MMMSTSRFAKLALRVKPVSAFVRVHSTAPMRQQVVQRQVVPSLAAYSGNDGQYKHGMRVLLGAMGLGALAALGVQHQAQCEPKADEYLDEDVQGDSAADETFIDGARFYVPTSEGSKIKIFCGNGNWHLANEIALNLGVQLGRGIVGRFSDGEVKVSLLDSVRGQDVYVVQPMAAPVNENLMELIFMVTTLRRASARKITAVVPYYGYARSAAKQGSRTPIGAADVAKLLQAAGVDRVITVDLHHAQIQGFFGPSCPVDNLDVSGVAIPYFQTKFLKNPVVVSPDANGAARAKAFRDKLIKHGMRATLALIVDHNSPARGSKEPTNVEEEWSPEQIGSMELVGDVRGKDVIIFDDLVDSAGRVTKAAAKCKAAGARRIFAFATHGLFTGKATERIEKSAIIELAVSNTLPHAMTRTQGVAHYDLCPKVHQLSVGALLAEAIRRINDKESISELFM